MIDIRSVTVSFGAHTVLHNISAQFGNGEITGVVGLNGAGKSTFFNTLAQVVKPDSGEILFEDQPLSYHQVGYLETVNFFYSMITGREYLGIFDQTNERFNLEALQQYTRLPLDDRIDTYSTGMRKKLALLGVLKQDKPVYLLDEPFNGLDMETNKVLELIIGALKAKGKTIFLSSHILDPLLHVCDRIVFLEQGVFTRSFAKDQFSEIEQELFGRFRQEAGSVINSAI